MGFRSTTAALLGLINNQLIPIGTGTFGSRDPNIDPVFSFSFPVSVFNDYDTVILTTPRQTVSLPSPQDSSIQQ